MRYYQRRLPVPDNAVTRAVNKVGAFAMLIALVAFVLAMLVLSGAAMFGALAAMLGIPL